MSEAPTPKKLNLIIESNNNIKYSIDIYSNSNSFLQIDINSLNKIPQIYYQQQFSLENIQKLGKYFLMCESISDVLISLEPNIQNNNKIELLEETNEIILIIPLNNPLCPQIIFNIKQKKKDISELMNEIYNIINNQQNEINNLKQINENQQNEINKLKEINEKQQNEINKLNNEINNFKKLNENQQNENNKLNNEINKLKEKVNELEEKKKKEIEQKENEKKLYEISLNSKIIPNDYNKEKVLREWINQNKEIKFKLLFRKSRDGSNGKDFHRYCDNKGPTLTLIHTNKGKIFGGYTPINWESPDRYIDKTDDLTFIFSLNSMIKFTKYKEGRSIKIDKNYGPCFGSGSDLSINPDMNTGWISNYNYLRKLELTDGENSFVVNEIEVFKVEI